MKGRNKNISEWYFMRSVLFYASQSEKIIQKWFEDENNSLLAFINTMKIYSIRCKYAIKLWTINVYRAPSIAELSSMIDIWDWKINEAFLAWKEFIVCVEWEKHARNQPLKQSEGNSVMYAVLSLIGLKRKTIQFILLDLGIHTRVRQP